MALDLFTDTATPATPRVSQLAIDIQRALREVGSGWVEGEVQRRKTIGGHTYFTLADEDASIDCVVWRSRAQRIQQWPAEGQLVQVHFERVDFYARRGSTSLHVDAIRLTGEGELLARKQATLDKLTADGLVARARRPLPGYPRRVGVIAAAHSDAKTDVIKALRERWPAVHIVFRAALVEGVRAVDSVIGALAHLQDIDAVDVIIVARGGGGVRDLVAFDDERLCRAVFACDVPVVTSIGHTAQRPNCDHVSAAYADVPARTAELVVPSAVELCQDLDRYGVLLENVPKLLRDQVGDLAELWERARPQTSLRRRDAELDVLDSRLRGAAASFHSAREKTLDDARHRLAVARSKVPAPAVLDLPAQQLLTAAHAFYADRADELDAAGRSLAAARARLPQPDAIDELARRLGPAAGRARRRDRDYERALERLRVEAGKAFARRIGAHDRLIADLGDDLGAAARRRLADRELRLNYIGLAGARRAVGKLLSEQDEQLAELLISLTAGARRSITAADTQLAHVAELIAARDFRRLGWVLAGDGNGNPIRSAGALTPGAELTLDFHDGRATAAVTTISTNNEGAING
jgi:exodeoxyribonuclease VII large subunit